MFRLRFVFFCLTGCLSFLDAQTASLTGRVADPTGAIIQGAHVSVESAATSIAVKVETNTDGFYIVPSLQPGRYTVTVTKEGFVPLKQSGLELQVQQAARLDLTLQLGAVTESVQVSAQALLLDSESSTVGQVIGSKQVAELPLLGRNPYALAMLVPSVRPSGGVNNLPVDQISTVSFMINGQRASANEFLLDGAPNSSPSQNQPVINSNPDTVQEFKVETNNFSAEYGRAAGGVFNVVTKSGSNDPHFNVYEFFRNDKLNASDFFANQSGQPRPPFKFNQFGGTFGGPVVLPKLYDGRNRTFLFASVELVRFIQGTTFLGTIPDPVQLTGDFSSLRNAAGNAITLYDPNTTRANPAGGFLRTPFAGNRIPGDRIHPIARNLFRYFPTPNTQGAPFTGVNNYARTDGSSITKDTFSLRGDHNFSANSRMFVRYSYDDSPFKRASPYGPDNIGSPATGAQIFNRQNAVVEHAQTVTPSLLGTIRYSFTRLGNQREPWGSGFDIASLGLPANLQSQIGEPRAFPAITITGYGVTASPTNIGTGYALGASDIIRLGNNSHALQGNMTKSLTRHTLKFGGEARVIQFNNLQTGANAVEFNFTPVWTQGPNPTQSTATAGHALATFLLGVTGGGVRPVPALAQTNRYYGLFLQDTYKATSTLTLNLGIRWDYETPRKDRFNQLTNFDFNARSPLQAAGYDLRGGLTFVGVGGLSRYNAEPDRTNISPRFGFSWKALPKTVIRGGGGLFYASATGIGTGSAAFGISGFSASTNIVTSLDGVTPIVQWSNPYPDGINQPSGSKLGLSTLLGQDITFFNRGNKLPYSMQWNFNIQRELPFNMVAEVGYAASRGLGFQQNRQWNQLPDAALAQGDALRQQVTNPFFGQISVGTLAQRNVARAQLLRPYPHFTAVTSQNEHNASSTYHAMESRLEKRLSRNLTFLTSYTYSKLMDYNIGPFAGETLSGDNVQNWNNLAAEKASSLADMTHRFIVNTVYELPLARNAKGAQGKLLGGWQMAAIWSSFSGGPLGITSNTNNNFSQGGGQRPNWNGVSPSVDNPTAARWLSAAPFSNPAPYAFGTAPRTFNGTRSDGTAGLDITFTKNTTIAERFQLQFRAEIFNFTNSPRFAPPNVVFGNPQFGVVNAQGNSPRVVQFALKLSR
ncbi:MAG: TonB-dependent receptor [Acidobacteria bacterium]|nr:TonB-dependent receptor [Acidobacteriota bacterium]